MSAPRPTPPPVFAVTITAFAAAVGYVSIAAPYWLTLRGVSLADIGWMSGIALAPHGFKFAWAPLIDVGSRRRAWYVATTLLAAGSIAALALLPAPEKHLALFTALAFLANALATTSCAAADGLMAITTAPDHRGRAGAWRMAGNVGGTGVLAWGAMKLAALAGMPVAGGAMAALIAASAVAALWIHEPRGPGGAWRDALRQLATIGRDVWLTAKSREGWTGLIICAVPVGACALTNLFSAIGPYYGAGEDRVGFVSGLWGGIIGAAGSFVGGWIADRMNRRLAYALSGGLVATTALAMLAAPVNVMTYTWGTLAYNFATGVSFAALAAFVLDMAGHGAAATKYTLFIAVSNLAGSYVTALDGWASEFRGLGARGTIAADAILTLAGIGVLLGMVWWTRRAAPPGYSASASGA